MNINELFAIQQEVAEKLKTVLRDRGYTKVSFSKQSGIARPTLNNILAGTCPSITTFNTHYAKILNTLSLTPDSLFAVQAKNPKVSAVYSDYTPESYKPTEKELKQCDLLENLLALASTYAN